ncbi:hypothetical protein M432DRAFT_671490 [Thermoascus aurantiacus ATCC 26904]
MLDGSFRSMSRDPFSTIEGGRAVEGDGLGRPGHIDQLEFLRLIRAQLAQDHGSNADYVPLDLFGSLGSLFKVHLSSYSYTLIANWAGWSLFKCINGVDIVNAVTTAFTELYRLRVLYCDAEPQFTVGGWLKPSTFV